MTPSGTAENTQAAATERETHLIVQKWSLFSVKTGKLPNGVDYYWKNSLTKIADYFHPYNTFPEEIVGKTTSELDTEYVDLDGTIYRIDELPENAARLSSGHARLLLNRFRRQFSREQSSGRAATCFELHINYIIGDSQTLNDLRINLIKNMCRIVVQRPTPSLFMVHQIVKSLDNPQRLRRILSASIWNKMTHVDDIRQQAKNLYDLKVTTSASPRVLFLGYSQSQAALLRGLNSLVSKHSPITVLIPQLSRDHEYSSPINPAYIGSTLKDHYGLSYKYCDVDQLASEKIDFAITSVKAWTWEANGAISLFVSEQAGYAYTGYRNMMHSHGLQSMLPKVVAVAGSFKLWPKNFREAYFERLSRLKNRFDFSHESVALDQVHVDSIVTEKGILQNFQQEDNSGVDSFRPFDKLAYLFLGSEPSWTPTDALYKAVSEASKGGVSKSDVRHVNDEVEFVIDNLFYDKGTHEAISASEDRSELAVQELPFNREALENLPPHLLVFSKDLLTPYLEALRCEFVQGHVDPKKIALSAKSALDKYKSSTSQIGAALTPTYRGPLSANLMFLSKVVRLAPDYYLSNKRSFEDLTAAAEKYVIDNAEGVDFALEVPGQDHLLRLGL